MRVLITGASSGLGCAIAQEVAKYAESIFLVGRDTTRLEQTKTEIQQNCGFVSCMTVDICQEEGFLALNKVLVDQKIDTLILSAGEGVYGNFFDIPFERYEALIELNIKSNLRLIHAFEKIAFAKKLVFISSHAAYSRLPRFLVYGVTKTFISEVLRGLRAQTKFKMTIAYPGAMDTNFQKTSGVPLIINKPLPPRLIAKKIIHVLISSNKDFDEVYFSLSDRLFYLFGKIMPYNFFDKFSSLLIRFLSNRLGKRK
jgi:short-subunit dehydrogenase